MEALATPRGISGGTGLVRSETSRTATKYIKSTASTEVLVKAATEIAVGMSFPLSSRHLCPVLGCDISDRWIRFEMPRHSCDLVDLLNAYEDRMLPPKLVEIVIRGTPLGLAELEDVLGADASHSDLKLDNVVVSHKGGKVRACLIDFGHARSRKFWDNRARLEAWQPPDPHEMGIASDMWSVGILGLQLLSARCRSVLYKTPRGMTLALVTACTNQRLKDLSHLPFRRQRCGCRGDVKQAYDFLKLADVKRAAEEFLSRAGSGRLLEVIRSCLDWGGARRGRPRDLAGRLGTDCAFSLPSQIVEMDPEVTLLDDFTSPLTREHRRRIRKIVSELCTRHVKSYRSRSQVLAWISALCGLTRESLQSCVSG